MVRNQLIDNNILIISEDKESFILYMEFFLENLRFQKHNDSELKKFFKNSNHKTIKESYFIKTQNSQRIKIALICPKKQSYRGIIELAKNLKDEKWKNEKIKFNKIFCVFDATTQQENPGNFKIYQEIISPNNLQNLNKKYSNEIEIINSNPSYEIWLLNHFQKFSAKNFKNAKEVIEEIEKNLRAKNKNFEYEKNNKDWFKKFIDEKKINQAIKNCQDLEKHHLEHKNENLNPSSKIYKIINFIYEIYK